MSAAPAIGSIEAIAPDIVASLSTQSTARTTTLATAAPLGGSFGEMLSQGLGRLNESLLTSQADMQALARGDVQNLHQIMIRLEESRLSFQLMLQVRNRLLEAYQDVMKMQV